MTKRVPKGDSGSGLVWVGSVSVQANWDYRYLQEDATGPTREGSSPGRGDRDRNEWTVAVSVEDVGKFSALRMGSPTTLQVGSWPPAPVYFHGWGAGEEDEDTPRMFFSDEPWEPWSGR